MLTGCPSPLKSICRRAMKNVPSKRFQSAKEIAEEVERYLANERTVSHQESMREKVVRKIRGNPLASLILGGAIASVLLLSTFSGMMFYSHKIQSEQVLKLAEQKTLIAEQANELHKKSQEMADLRKKHIAEIFQGIILVFDLNQEEADTNDHFALDTVARLVFDLIPGATREQFEETIVKQAGAMHIGSLVDRMMLASDQAKSELAKAHFSQLAMAIAKNNDDMDRALTAARKSFEVFKDEAGNAGSRLSALRHVGGILIAQEKWNEAEESANLLLDECKSDSDMEFRKSFAYSSLSMIRSGQGRDDEALEFAKRCVDHANQFRDRLRPTQVLIFQRRRIELLLKMERFENVVKSASELLDSVDPAIYDGTGKRTILEIKNMMAEAQSRLQK